MLNSKVRLITRVYSISSVRGEQIVRVLKNDMITMDPKFRHWVKKKGFKLLSYP